jgi:hypothetical protein
MFCAYIEMKSEALEDFRVDCSRTPEWPVFTTRCLTEAPFNAIGWNLVRLYQIDYKLKQPIDK